MGKMNVWLLNELIEKETFESIIKPEFLLKAMCLIVVDLSRVYHLNLALGNYR